VKNGNTHTAVDGAFFLGCVAESSVADVISDVADEIALDILNRARHESGDTIPSLFVRDGYVGALCQLDRRFGFWGIDRFLQMVGSFLPAFNNHARLGDICGYLCEKYDEAQNESKMRIFQIFVHFSAIGPKLRRLLRDSFFETSDCVGMLQILTNVMNETENPADMISALFSGDQTRIALFREFLNNLSIMAAIDSENNWIGNSD
jgi:hypothetical protein